VQNEECKQVISIPAVDQFFPAVSERRSKNKRNGYSGNFFRNEASDFDEWIRQKKE
jgi:hypothetical protein